MEIMGTVSSLIDLARKAKVAADAVRNSEAKLAMAELISQLTDLKIKVADLVSENQGLQKQVDELTKQKAQNLTLVGDVYMAENDGPFCTTCWETKTVRVRLKEELRDFQSITGHKYVCPVCHSRHKGDG